MSILGTIIVLTSGFLCAIGGVAVGWYLRGYVPAETGEVVLPSLSPQASQGTVDITTDWEFPNVPSEREIDEREWAREKGLFEDEEDRAEDSISSRIHRMGGRLFNLRVAR